MCAPHVQSVLCLGCVPARVQTHPLLLSCSVLETVASLRGAIALVLLKKPKKDSVRVVSCFSAWKRGFFLKCGLISGGQVLRNRLLGT